MTIRDVPAADLRAAVLDAQPGDVLRLAPGVQSLPALSKIVKAGEVVIDGTGATVAEWDIVDSANITVLGLNFAPPAKGYGLQVARSRGIRLEATTFAGPVAAGAEPMARGLQFTDVQDVAVVDTAFRSLRYGLMGSKVSGAAFERIDVRDIWGDGARGWTDSSDLIFRTWRITDLHNPAEATHVDAIQFWTVNSTKPTARVLIEDIIYTRGHGDGGQGIFMNDETGVGYEDVTIRNNAIIGSIWNGIYLIGCKGAVIEDNLVQTMAWGPQHADLAEEKVRARIVAKAITGGRIGPNAARLVTDKKRPLIDVNTEGNVEPADAALDSYAGLAAWQGAKAPPVDPRDAEIADLRAKLAAAEACTVENEAALTAALADLKGARAQLEMLEADRTEDRAAMQAAAEALAAALATQPAA